MLTRTDTAPRWRAAVLAIGALGATATAAAAPGAPTLTAANLNTAYAADLHAQARYAAFASQAQQERLGQLAALFRAAAHAEGVRARLHADAFRRMGTEPLAPPPPAPRVGTTRANLVSVLAHENAERARTYPALVEQARRDGAIEAILAFTLAHHAEAGLLRLYQEAFGALRPKEEPVEAFHVCETCGHVVRGGPPERCPVSLTPRSGFRRVA